jgi:glutamyl-tRNA synthetase
MSRLYFTQSLEYSEDASTQLQQQESTAVLQGILTGLDTEQLTEASIQDIIKRVTKEQNVKKGVVMRSLRAALMGDMHGPDLIQSWLILHQLGQDKPRLQQAIAHNSQSSLK